MTPALSGSVPMTKTRSEWSWLLLGRERGRDAAWRGEDGNLAGGVPSRRLSVAIATSGPGNGRFAPLEFYFLGEYILGLDMGGA